MKYQGSKQRIVHEMLEAMRPYMDLHDTFVDMFCGGCSVIQNVPVSMTRIANDKNKYLIAMWKSLTAGKQFPTYIPREFYSSVRDCANGKNNDYDDDLVGWVGYMASFNGRFFDGGYSGHDVKSSSGKTRDYISENIRNITAQIPMLKDVRWNSDDYFNVRVPEKSLIYCDIPYRDTKQYFTSRGFDYDRFYGWCMDMKSAGHTIIVSEYDMPSEFECIWEKPLVNSMNQTNTKIATERLFIVR